MKIAVMGAGSLGSVFAALFAQSGNEVWAIRRSADHVAAINRGGLRVQGASGDRTIRVHATTDPAEAGRSDIVIVATKSYDLYGAVPAMSPLIAGGTLVISMQNGLGAGEALAARYDPAQIIIGVAESFGASTVGLAHVHHNSMRLIRLSGYKHRITPRLQTLAEAWIAAGFAVKLFDDSAQCVWEKLVCNAAFGAVSALTQQSIGELMSSAPAWEVALGCGCEAYSVGRALGIEFSFRNPARYIEDFGRNMPHARTSMLQDHLAGRRSEIDAINGAVASLGSEVGVSVPFNRVVTALIWAREQTFALEPQSVAPGAKGLS